MNGARNQLAKIALLRTRRYDRMLDLHDLRVLRLRGRRNERMRGRRNERIAQLPILPGSPRLLRVFTIGTEEFSIVSVSLQNKGT